MDDSGGSWVSDGESGGGGESWVSDGESGGGSCASFWGLFSGG